jgi:glucokinase
MRHVGAVDIGGTKIAVGVVREDGTILHRLECATDPHRGFVDAVDRIVKMLQQCVLSSRSIVGVGVGCPGPLDPFTGVIGDVGTLPSWQGGQLAAELSQRLGLSVAVENDADAASLAEYAWGSSPTRGTLIYLTVSTGIGGGIVQGGQLYRSRRGAHPELGHQAIDPSGPLCYCRISGCWESLASGPAMSSWFQSADPKHQCLTAAEICTLAKLGDPLALEAVKREAYYLGLGMANLVTLFVPDVICLGGGVMKSSDLFLEEICSTVRTLCTQVPADDTIITLSSLGHDTGLLGAAQAWLLRHSVDASAQPAHQNTHGDASSIPLSTKGE